MVFSRWSCRRPGVATTTCGRFESAIDCVIMSMPPTMVAHRTPIVAPSASICCEIWYDSSRVGASTQANSARGSSQSAWSSGSE